MSKEIRNSIFNLPEGTGLVIPTWKPQTLVVENATPTHVVITSAQANTNLVASDFVINGITANVLLISRDGTNKIITAVLDVPVYYGDVLNVSIKGKSYSTTNNVAILAEYTAVYNAMVSKPVGNDIIYQNKWLASLVNNGTYAKAIVLDNLSTHDAVASLFNWKTPASFNPSAYGSPTFTAYKGYLGSNSPSKWITTNFTPSINHSNFIGVDDMTVITGINTEVVEAFADFGSNGISTNKRVLLSGNITDNKFRVAINSSGYVDTVSSCISKRYLAATRNNNANITEFRNHVTHVRTSASIGFCDDVLRTGVSGTGNTKYSSFVLIFKALTNDEVKSVIKICDEYLKRYTTNIIEYQTAIDFNLSLEGHSFLAENNTAALIYIDYIIGGVNAYNYYPNATAGATIANCVTRQATVDAQLVTETATMKNIMCFYIGYNDINDTAGTGTTAYNATKSYIQARITAGWKVFIYTMTPAITAGHGAGFEAKRIIFNNLIRNDLSLINGVYVLDTNTVAELTDCSNATYFNADKLHPITAGGKKLADLFTAKMVELYG